MKWEWGGGVGGDKGGLARLYVSARQNLKKMLINHV